MAKKDNTQKRNNSKKLFTANFSTVLSIALVLFMLAFIVMFSFHAYYLSNQIKEEVSFTVYMTGDSSENDAKQVQYELNHNPIVKTTRYISSQDAALMMNKVMGNNHLDVLDGYNPYEASIEVHLKAKDLNVRQIKQFIRTLESKPTVDLVDYRDDLINDINGRIYDISAFVIVILAFLLFISITLINHTISLTINNKKLLIRSMQLVGAKPSFIRRPFIIKGLWLGFIGGVVADVLICGVMLWIYTLLQDLDFSPFYNFYIVVGIGIIALGVLLTFLFSYVAVIKNMNLKNYKLYN
jgi:cell division transport system permease protein